MTIPDFCQACNALSTDEGVTLSRCSRFKVFHYCSVKCQKEDWKASHKKQCAEIVAEMNVEPKNTMGLPNNLWNLLKDKAQKPTIVPLPKPTPELREKYLKGECNPIRDAMLKDAEKGRPMLSFGRGGASTFADGKRGPSPPKRLTAGVTTPFSRLESKIWLHDRAEIDVCQLLIDNVIHKRAGHPTRNASVN